MMNIDFEKMNGLVPAIIQDSITKNVLMLGFMNEEAYQKTLATKRVTFYSRSRKCLWTKGETSGNYLELVSMKPDCDNDTLLQTLVGEKKTNEIHCFFFPSSRISLTNGMKKCPKSHIQLVFSKTEQTAWHKKLEKKLSKPL